MHNPPARNRGMTTTASRGGLSLVGERCLARILEVSE